MDEEPVDAAMGGTPVAKKPYVVPRLVVYGDIRMITETKAHSGADGGAMAGSTFSK